jgi:mono/diheme cytochrome c family protein
MSFEPQSLRPPEWGGPKGFDYASVVQPVLDRRCAGCHAPPNAPKGVDLTGDKTDFFNVSYETLARGRRSIGEGEVDNPFTSWIPTYNGQEANILVVTPKAWGSPASKLSRILLSGHPGADGKPRIDITDDERRRIFAWIDLNVPYYGTSETAYPERRGCRQILPDDLGKVLADVGKRRCAECHADGKFPRKVWTRITNPQYNDFLLAPLAPSAGGNGRCGRAVFASADDPDYQAILKTFDPVLSMLKERPRMDMPGAVPACDVNRSTK